MGKALRVWTIVVLCVFGAGSCRGAKLHSISGHVTFHGQPVPSGTVTLEPEGAGPGLVAQIREGRYVSLPNTGHVGGPHHIRIIGFDGIPTTLDDRPDGMELPTGKPLFPPYETIVELPRASTTRDFEVPSPPTDGSASVWPTAGSAFPLPNRTQKFPDPI